MKGHNFGDTNCLKCGRIHIHPRGMLGKHNKGSKPKGWIPWSKGKTKVTDMRLASSAMKIALWRKGKTKENSEFVKRAADSHSLTLRTSNKKYGGRFQKGQNPWNKNLTKESDPRILAYSRKLIGHKVNDPFIFNRWRFENGVIATYPKARYIEELGHCVRSSWEETFAKELKARGIRYFYEPKRFILDKEGKQSWYTPDFFLPDSNIFIEIKGPLTDASILRMNLFKDQYPDIKLLVLLNKAYDGSSIHHEVHPWEEHANILWRLH